MDTREAMFWNAAVVREQETVERLLGLVESLRVDLDLLDGELTSARTEVGRLRRLLTPFVARCLAPACKSPGAQLEVCRECSVCNAADELGMVPDGTFWGRP